MTLSILYILGSLQAIFLAFLLFKTRNMKWEGNLYLSYLLLIVASLLAIFSARILLNESIYPWLFWPITATPALIGPCFYFYIRSFYTQEIVLSRSKVLHFIPFILLITIFFPETIANPASGLELIDSATTIKKTLFTSYIKSILILGYLLYCLRLLSDEKLKSLLYQPGRKFLQVIIFLFLIVTVIGSFLSTLRWLGLSELYLADNVELSALSVFTYLLAYYVFYYDVKPIKIKDKYVNSALTESARKELSDSIKKLMGEHLLFLEENYSAKLLTAKLGISEQYLSEVIALEFKSNFNNLSNQYRFEHFKQLLLQDSNNNLLDLAYASGFKSKSSFNRVIKEYSGMTPKAFRMFILNSN